MKVRRGIFRKSERAPYDQDKDDVENLDGNDGGSVPLRDENSSTSVPPSPRGHVKLISTTGDRDPLLQPPAMSPTLDQKSTVEPSGHPARPEVQINVGGSGTQKSKFSHPKTSATQGLVTSHVIGNGSKFGSSDWWDVSPNKRWWKLTETGLSSDFQCDAGTVGDTAAIAGTLRGWKHQIKGEQNEDAFYLGNVRSQAGAEYVVAVLADGLSSAKYSAYASRRITQMIGRGISLKISTALSVDKDWVLRELGPVFDSAANRVKSFSVTDYGAPLVAASEVGERDLLVTLTFAIVEAVQSNDGQRSVIAGFIGDSPLFVLDAQGWSKKSGYDQTEEIVENRTRAFPADQLPSFIDFKIGIEEVVIMTSDGVGNFISSGDTMLALGEYLRQQWSKPVNALTFLNHLNFNLNSADDDRTAIAIWSAVEDIG